MEEEKREHTTRMKKMESEMEQVFEMKVKEKMSKLTELEADVSTSNRHHPKRTLSIVIHQSIKPIQGNVIVQQG